MATVKPSRGIHSLTADFYARPALTVARAMLGKVLVRDLPGGAVRAVIHEVEAYIGPHDLACHAAKGHTPRTSVMFGPAGNWYVYFIYGIHWMLNVVTEREGFPAAVLIRGAGAWNGPAKLTKALSIDNAFNGQPAFAAPGNSGRSRSRDVKTSPSGLAILPGGLWIEDHALRMPRGSVACTPRIGVDYAGAWAAKPYRFVLAAPVVSKFQEAIDNQTP